MAWRLSKTLIDGQMEYVEAPRTSITTPRRSPSLPLQAGRIVLLCLLLSLLLPLPKANAQLGAPRRGIAVGLGGGMSMSSVGFDPTVKQKQHLGPTFGVVARFTSEKYFAAVCALQLELNYSQLGWTENIMNRQNEPLPDTFSRTLSYVQFPMLARLGWGREHRGLMGYFMAGPQVGYLLGDQQKRSSQWTCDEGGVPVRPNGVTAQYELPVKHKFDYGITAGVGAELSTAAGHWMLDARYYYGLADIFGSSKRDVFGRSNLSAIIVRLTWLLDLRKD